VTTAVVSAGLADFQRRRKQDSRESLLAAARESFCEVGYFAVSVEDITSAAGVSRMTFYRHFSGKPAIASELFRLNVATAMPRLLAIGARDFRDRAVVKDWIADLFAADRASRQLLQVFIQASVEGGGFAETGHSFIADMITGLGRKIPAFALGPSERRQWLEAWLLIYEILDQGNHAARESGVATDPLVTEILADRFLAFVSRAA
jgi:AcrR family transcriptional regulator